MNKKVDYLIVGQGLAGSFLAFQLLQQNKRFLIIDKGLSFSSSYIAAGVINPLVLKRYTKSWRAEEFINYNPSFYAGIEELLSQKYLFELPIKKLISSKDEATFWQLRLKKEDLTLFMEEELQSVDPLSSLQSNLRTGTVKKTSWLNISSFLSDFRSYLLSEEKLLEEEFDYNILEEGRYKEMEFEKIIFCEGAKAEKNPFFPSSSFSLNKGQLITIKSESLKLNDIYKKKVFILPQSNHEYKVGATYSWKWDKTSEKGGHEPEQEKTAQLKEMFSEMCEVEFKIIKEEAGIRPAVKDRRPLMGQHPEKKDIYFFNGMGSKGCLMAPLLSKEFIDYLNSNQKINKEVNIQRYF